MIKKFTAKQKEVMFEKMGQAAAEVIYIGRKNEIEKIFASAIASAIASAELLGYIEIKKEF